MRFPITGPYRCNQSVVNCWKRSSTEISSAIWTPMVFLLNGNLDFCPNHRPLTPSPLLFMIGMGIWRIARVLLWRCLTCQKPLTMSLTVPSCLSLGLLSYLVPCTLGLGHISLTDHSWWLSMVLPPILFPSYLVSPGDQSWAHFFSSSMGMTFVSLTLPPIVRLSCMQMTPLSINLFPNHPICPTSKLTSIPSTTGSAVINLLLTVANAAKTKSMVISIKKDPFPDMILHLNNQPIKQISSAKFLGIWITQNLFLESPGWSYLQERTIKFIHRLSTVPRSVPAVFSI